MNQNSWWRYLVIVAVLIPGFIYALPNLFGDDPGIQIRAARTTGVDSALLGRVESILEQHQVAPLGLISDEKGVRVRFSNTEEQLQARDVLQEALGNRHTVALTLVPSTPSWMHALGLAPMYLGLDLRGGVHFLMEVDLDSAINRAEDRYVESLRTTLRENKVRYASVRRTEREVPIEVKFRNPDARSAALDVIADELPELEVREFEREGEYYVSGNISTGRNRRIKRFCH